MTAYALRAPLGSSLRRVADLAAPAGLLLLCVAWILPMLVGHDPWKPDEAYSFGLVLDQLERGDWVVPMLAGEPFLEKPPLFYIVASGFAKLFGGVLPLHDAARLASGFFMSLALIFLALTARELNRGRQGWTAVLVLLGCLGLYFRAHQLITDVALFAGMAIGMFGLACGRRLSIAGGLALGAGVAIAFLSKGLLGPGILAVTALTLPLFAGWRNRAYLRTLALATAVALPPIASWTAALYARSAELFHTWLVTNNFGRFFGFVDNNLHQPPFFYAYTILWYAFPALPLAGWALGEAYPHRDGLRFEPTLQLPLVMCGVTIGVLGLAADARELYLMPVLLPLALLGAVGIGRLPPDAATVFDQLGKWAFGLAALALWLGWVAMMTGAPGALAHELSAYRPGFVAWFSWPVFLTALVASVLWIALTWPIAATARGALIQWTGGVALCGTLIGTLWLPYLDAGKSYRGMIVSLLGTLPDANCIASRHLGEPQRALLDYFGRLRTVRVEVDPNFKCELLLVQGSRARGAPAHGKGWMPVWAGARPGDHRELFRLYARGAAATRVESISDIVQTEDAAAATSP
jgi:4-amino-4-deoxy-L-arabinose transferase-like glycosyltransferase